MKVRVKLDEPAPLTLRQALPAGIEFAGKDREILLVTSTYGGLVEFVVRPYAANAAYLSREDVTDLHRVLGKWLAGELDDVLVGAA